MLDYANNVRGDEKINCFNVYNIICIRKLINILKKQHLNGIFLNQHFYLKKYVMKWKE